MPSTVLSLRLMWLTSTFFDNGYAEAFLSEQSQNILFDTVIISNDPKSDWRQFRFVVAIAVRDRPRLAQFVVKVPLVNFRRRNFFHVIHADHAFAVDCALDRLFDRHFLSR